MMLSPCCSSLDSFASVNAPMERMNATGRLDVQSHGYWHKYLTDETQEGVVRQEIVDPIDVLEEHFGDRPTAFVWPGGNFTPDYVTLGSRDAAGK